jgi:hypothetical protein
LEGFARLRLVGPLGLRLGLGLATPLVRARAVFLVDGEERVFDRTNRLVPELNLGLELRVPSPVDGNR